MTSGYASSTDGFILVFDSDSGFNLVFDSDDLVFNSDNMDSSTLILDNSETDEEDNSVAESSGSELLDEPKCVPSSTSSLSQPHIFNSCQPPCHCMRCIIYNSQLLQFKLPEAYRHQQNNSDTC